MLSNGNNRFNIEDKDSIATRYETVTSFLDVQQIKQVSVLSSLVECLENESVQYIFTVFGTDYFLLEPVFRNSHIQLLPVPSETEAVYMANAYSRLSGHPGVCLVASAVAATKFIGGAYDAKMNRLPLVIIAIESESRYMHIDHFQQLSLTSVFAPVTNWSDSVFYPNQIVEKVRKAFAAARIGQLPDNHIPGTPGAVYLHIPEHIAIAALTEKSVEQSMQPIGKNSCRLDGWELKGVSALIAQARCPIILVGGLASYIQDHSDLITFAESLNIPVVTTVTSKGIIPDSHPLSEGTVGGFLADYTNIQLDRIDLVITIGFEPIEWSPQQWNGQRDKSIIHISPIPLDEISRNYTPVVEFIGDLSIILREMLQIVDHHSQDDYHRFHFRASIPILTGISAENSSSLLSPQSFVRSIRAALDSQDIVISDGGIHNIWLAQYYSCEQINTCLLSDDRFTSRGQALSKATAAKLIYPECRIVVILEDRDFINSFQEIQTALKFNTPFVICILDTRNRALEKSNMVQRSISDFHRPDCSKIAESMGIETYQTKSASDLSLALSAAINQTTPVLIECSVVHEV